MKLFIYVLLYFLATSLSAKENILVTSFEPFGGKTSNNSMLVANELKEIFKNSTDLQISLCNLPVVYDLAAQKILECIAKEKMKPKIVLSLGESGCRIRFEDSAKNRDFDPTIADNKYQVRNNREIVKNGPKEIKFSLPMHKMYCAEKDPDIREDYFTASKSMGGFVCNNTAYILAKTIGKKVKYGFIHVPREQCKDIGNSKKIAQFIAKGILEITKNNRIKKRATNIQAMCLQKENQLNPLKMKSNLDLAKSIESIKEEFCLKEYEEE